MIVKSTTADAGPQNLALVLSSWMHHRREAFLLEQICLRSSPQGCPGDSFKRLCDRHHHRLGDYSIPTNLA